MSILSFFFFCSHLAPTIFVVILNLSKYSHKPSISSPNTSAKFLSFPFKPFAILSGLVKDRCKLSLSGNGQVDPMKIGIDMEVLFRGSQCSGNWNWLMLIGVWLWVFCWSRTHPKQKEGEGEQAEKVEEGSGDRLRNARYEDQKIVTERSALRQPAHDAHDTGNADLGRF